MKTLEKQFTRKDFLKAKQLVTSLGFETERFEIDSLKEAKEFLESGTEKTPHAIKVVFEDFESVIIRK